MFRVFSVFARVFGNYIPKNGEVKAHYKYLTFYVSKY